MISTSNKMLLIAAGYTKKQVKWNKNDEEKLNSLVPCPIKLLKYLKKK